MADWDAVKRLAADFQKVQLSSTNQRLSERNCIEIVSWLIEKKMIDLIFTSDGKEYLTPQQLKTEIKNELYASGGRINLTDLSKIIGVDLGPINLHLHDILKEKKNIYHILGQLIDSSYIVSIATEINEKLQQNGEINVGELTIAYDLPAEFLQRHVLEKFLGKLIIGKQDAHDSRIIFTESFIARSKAKIRGALAGLTKPTQITSILNHIDISEKLFLSLVDQISMFGSLNKKSRAGQYIPHCYALTQMEWVTDFYGQNGYIEYDGLVKIGITDYKTYLKKRFADEFSLGNIILLESCAISKNILDRLEADIDECITSGNFIDLQTCLPSILSIKDISLILNKVVVGTKEKELIQLEDYLISKKFIENLITNCNQLIKEKAKSLVESGKYQQYVIDSQSAATTKSCHKFESYDEIKPDRKEDRRKKFVGGGKSGGGTQGREIKVRSTKRHARANQKNNESDNDENESGNNKKSLEIINMSEIKTNLESILNAEGLQILTDSLAEYILPILNESGLKIAAELYAINIADQTSSKRIMHNELQTKLNSLLTDVRLFDKGLKLFQDDDMQTQLIKYLLKTHCTDIVTDILNYASKEAGFNTSADNFNTEQRLKFVNKLPAEFRTPLRTCVESLAGQSIDEFLSAADLSLTACSMIVKKADKKKDRLVVLNYKRHLLEKINDCEDVALLLHLATLIIFTTATNRMLHASGRHVSNLLTFLKSYLSECHYAELQSYYDSVMLMLGNGSEAENAKKILEEKAKIIKNIAMEYKKSGAENI